MILLHTMSNSRPTLSVAIISFNEELRIAQCIKHVKAIADEIIVVDSESSDRTGEIAESLGAKVYHEKWKGFAAQKNSALEKCSSEWVLFLDCDEVLSEEVCNNIVQAVKQRNYNGYKIKRISQFMGKFVKYSWGHDWLTRLVLRDKGRWTGQYVHERLECDGNIGKIEGLVYHYTYTDYVQELTKGVLYAKLGAQALCSQNKKIRLFHLILNPLWGFIKHYLVKMGFLDGFQGFVIALTNLHYTFCKYLIAWEMQHSDICKKTEIPKK